jgi:hypothetical protein
MTPYRKTNTEINTMKQTPDMKRKASDITDPNELFARIGYRTYLMWRDGDRSPADLYNGYILTELRRVQKLMKGAG